MVNFAIATNTIATTAAIGFGDQPLPRAVLDATAHLTPTVFGSGMVTIYRGFEANVTPRRNGQANGNIRIPDWVQVGRFAGGLDVVSNNSQFMRANCAPRTNGGVLVVGKGVINVAEWIQAGRYEAGIGFSADYDATLRAVAQARRLS